MGYTIATDKITYALTGGTGTLQDAINQAQTSKLPLFILPGTYPTGDLVISAPVEMYATPGTVQLQPAFTTNGFTLNIRSNTVGTYITDVTIRGITFYGALLPFATALVYTQRWYYAQLGLAGNFNAMISAFQVTRLLIRDCNIAYSGSNGLGMWQCSATVENNTFVANRLAAVYACEGWASAINDNYIHEGENAGIIIARPTVSFDGTVVRGNHIYQINAIANTTTGQVSGSGWFGNGISVYHASSVIISDNVALNCAFSGIRIGAAWNCQIVGNQIYQSKETALFVEAPGGTPGETNSERYEGGIVANNVIVGGGLGISVTNAYQGGRRVVVSGNSVSGITKNTIVTNDNGLTYITTASGIHAEGDCVVTGNVVEGVVSGPGIVLTPNPIAGSTRKITGLASGNTVKGSQVGIAFYKEISNCYCFIEGNILEGYSNGAIVPMTLPAPYSTWTRVAGSSDYGTICSGTYTGKPFPNVMIGLNFAI